MCIERYLTAVYPERDWTPLAAHMWQGTEQRIDIGYGEYWDFIPELIDDLLWLSWKNPAKAEQRRRTLTPEDYSEICLLFCGNPETEKDAAFCRTLALDKDFCQLIGDLDNVWRGIDCTSAYAACEHTLYFIEGYEEILTRHHIALPEQSVMEEFRCISEQDDTKWGTGWGAPVRTVQLSVILNQKSIKGGISMTTQEKLEKIVRILDSKKAEDIQVIGITNLTIIADYFVIANGTSTTQVKALADEVEFQLSQLGEEPRGVEGIRTANWIVLDFNDIVVHVFLRDTRAEYQLERLWADGEQVDISHLLIDEGGANA